MINSNKTKTVKDNNNDNNNTNMYIITDYIITGVQTNQVASQII